MGVGGCAIPWLLYTWYPLYRRLGGPQCQSGGVRKISPQPGVDPWTVHPAASRYTDYAIPAPAAQQIQEAFLSLSLHDITETRITNVPCIHELSSLNANVGTNKQSRTPQ
jgi:hypothetical protein